MVQEVAVLQSTLLLVTAVLKVALRSFLNNSDLLSVPNQQTLQATFAFMAVSSRVAHQIPPAA